MNKKLIIIIALVLVVVAVAAVLILFVFGGDKELPYVRTEFSPGEYFVVNVMDTNRLLKVTVVMVLNTDTLTESLTEQNTEIRDAITTFLRAQSEETLRATDLSAMKAELATILNEMLEIDNITGILFSDYAIQ